MSANNPLANGVPTVQGPDPTGEAGYPIAVVPATSSPSFPVTVQAGGSSQPVTVADGADVAEGATTDAAVTGDAAGTVSAKLRGLSKILASVWSSVNSWLQVRQQKSATTTGTLAAAGQMVTAVLDDAAMVAAEVTGTWVGNIIFEGSADGTNFHTINGSIAGGGDFNGATTANNGFFLPNRGWNTIRARAGSWTSGTATISFSGTVGAGFPMVVIGSNDASLTASATSPVDSQGGVAGYMPVFAAISWATGPGFALGGQNVLARTPTTFKFATASAAGASPVWTPAAGKKFRLMRVMILISDDATLAVAGRDLIKLQDGTTDLPIQFTPFVPAAALNNAGMLFSSGWIELGNGIPSAAANNVLNVNLGTALATGLVQVITGGTEE